MKKYSYEFNCIDKHCYIKNVNIYSGLSYELNNYGDLFVLKLYFFKKYNNYDGDIVSCERLYDYFEFNNLEDLLIVYNDIKSLLEEC